MLRFTATKNGRAGTHRAGKHSFVIGDRSREGLAATYDTATKDIVEVQTRLRVRT